MLRLDNVTKIYASPNGQVHALDGVSLDVAAGEFVVLRGPSGSGKTTLLMTVAGMQKPTGGVVSFKETDLYAMTPTQRARFRADNIGFVFQMFHLVPYLNVLDNVLLASGAKGANHSPAQAQALIEKLGLSGRDSHKPSQLSAGEKQRVAIARAMLNKPRVIVADEPTGNLDPENAAVVLGYLSEFHKGGGTVVIVTHGAEADQFADRIISLQAGRIRHEN
ncbi:MAG: ABC transporter ATP-binding protein [Planctomycetota bacterium]|nr:MAG: ABC transporter ATP-binding protein [Planctomycetota bacterium]